MKRLLIPLLLLAICAFAQDVPFGDAMDVAPANGKLVIVSSDGEIVGLSENLSREHLEILVSPDFSGTGTLLITTADGGVLYEFAVAIHRGAVTMGDEPLTSLLATSGFHVTTIVAGEGLVDEAGPDRAPIDRSVPAPPPIPTSPSPPIPPVDEDAGEEEAAPDPAAGNGENGGDAPDSVDDRNPVGTP